jgi:ribosome-associated protein
MQITDTLYIDERELSETFIRSGGPGGQNVNKVATAVQLRFDVLRSPSLPEDIRARLLFLVRHRLTKEGVLIIIAQRYRTQDQNRQDARWRLAELIRRALVPPKKRIPTRPSKASKEERLKEKLKHGKIKKQRQAVKVEDG